MNQRLIRPVFTSLAWCMLVVGSFSGGWLHGRISNRWGAAEALRGAAEKLRQPLPDRIGNWRVVAEQPFTEDVVEMLQCPAHICRTYTNEQTGDNISVAVIVGPPGPISVHTPEICYSSQDYSTTSDRTIARIRDRDGHEHALWDLRLQANDINGTPLRILYGWKTGGDWSAAHSPRFAYGGAPYLYKIQLAATVTDGNDDYDACQQFLEAFLPELAQRLVYPEASVPAPASSSS